MATEWKTDCDTLPRVGTQVRHGLYDLGGSLALLPLTL